MRIVRKKFHERFFAVILVSLLTVILSNTVYASVSKEDTMLSDDLASQPVHILTNRKAVVFLLDASGSMKTNDPDRYAVDSIAQLIYTLPANYEVGFVAYNAEVCAVQGFVGNSQRKRIMETADSVQYAGYSNAGAGMEEAVSMLEAAGAEEKSIVLLSDGEILLEKEEDTSQSCSAYQRAIKRAAESGITIHVIGLGEEMEDTDNSIFQAAVDTEGSVYYSPQALDIQEAVNSILEDALHIKQMTAAIVDAGEDTNNLSIDMPFANASTVRVLLTSGSSIQNLKTNFKADDARQVNGERYSLIEIDDLKGDRIGISFDGTPASQVKITLIPEYKVLPKADIAYRDKLPQKESATRYERETDITVTFFDADNENIQLWTEDYFDHSEILIQAGKNMEKLSMEKGALLIQEIVIEDIVKELFFDYSLFPANVLNTGTLKVSLEGPPDLPVKEPEPEEPPYAVYGMIILAAMLFVGIAVVLFRKRTPQPMPEPENESRPAPGKSSYAGRLNIYITRTASGYDISPLSYDLFRLPPSRVISLGEVLENCGVKETFEGAVDIFFSSGQGRSIILTNQSDCCIMKSGEILMKRKSYQLFSGAKVDITFEDEISELTFQYRDSR